MGQSRHRKEIPCGTGYSSDPNSRSLSERSGLYDAHRPGINDYEDLMRCDFDEFPQETNLPLQGIWYTLEELLTPKELAVINFVVVGGMSLAVAGKYLGAEFPRRGVPTPYSKMAVSQLRDTAIAKIKHHLQETDGYE